MAVSDAELKARARQHAETMPLADIQVADEELFRTDTMWPYFERLRQDDPVHLSVHPQYGRYWSITKFADIIAIESNPDDFCSGQGTALQDADPDFPLPMFISMDPPRHDEQRKSVSPAVSPARLHDLEPLIRERAAAILDSLPIGEEFDWVSQVSIELTTMTLATLFDFPWEDRRKLTRWSDLAVAPEGAPGFGGPAERQAEMMECLEYFTRLWMERAAAEPRQDLISIMAHSEAMRDMGPMEFLGNLLLLIVGGNDTTRNTITGSVLALNENPDEYRKLRENPDLVPSMVSETIRWQTPVAHMRRTATRDVEIRGKVIQKGDKVVLWYVSGNRDAEVISDPDAYIIDRERPRQHCSFGFGIHRCVGNRLGEMQAKVVWEEILKRFPAIEVVGPPVRLNHYFIKGYESLPVIIPRRL